MLHIVTALPCEAKPLIKHYRLNGRQAENGFRIYENSAMRLIIAGIGKCAAAAACAYLQGAEPQTKHAWLNLGIAGHRDLNIGDAIIANKISDASSGASWYPAMPFKQSCPTIGLISVDQPNTEYNSNSAYDMEAAGFYPAAARFNSSELIQVFKIISDNHANPAGQVSAQQTEKIISAQLGNIDLAIKQLFDLNAQMAQQQTKQDMSAFQQRWHFTVSQQHQLQRLLQRWHARNASDLDLNQFETKKNSKSVIASLEKMIKNLPMRFDDK